MEGEGSIITKRKSILCFLIFVVILSWNGCVAKIMNGDQFENGISKLRYYKDSLNNKISKDKILSDQQQNYPSEPESIWRPRLSFINRLIQLQLKPRIETLLEAERKKHQGYAKTTTEHLKPDSQEIEEQDDNDNGTREEIQRSQDSQDPNENLAWRNFAPASPEDPQDGYYQSAYRFPKGSSGEDESFPNSNRIRQVHPMLIKYYG